MDYDRIILELLDRIKILEDEVSVIKAQSCYLHNVTEQKEIKSSKKYRRLTEWLASTNEKTVSITFSQIESLIGFPLPNSARAYREFWANTTTHSIALSWLSIGYKTVDVNLDTETIVFER